MDDGRSLCVSDGGKIGSSDVLCSCTSIEFIAFNSRLECRVWLLLLLILFCGSSISLIFADENSLIDFIIFLSAVQFICEWLWSMGSYRIRDFCCYGAFLKRRYRLVSESYTQKWHSMKIKNWNRFKWIFFFLRTLVTKTEYRSVHKWHLMFDV